MSRIAKQPITLPAGVVASLEAGELSVKGPLGNLTRRFRDDVKVELNSTEIIVTPVRNTILAKALSGTYASHIRNMIVGVSRGFEKKLLIEGVGYRYMVNGNQVKLDIGFSHPVEVAVPEGVKVTVEKNQMTISGFDKELVTGFASKIRSLKKAEPYKGKGIRYHDEIILRKQGKKAGATS